MHSRHNIAPTEFHIEGTHATLLRSDDEVRTLVMGVETIPNYFITPMSVSHVLTYPRCCLSPLVPYTNRMSSPRFRARPPAQHTLTHRTCACAA